MAANPQPLDSYLAQLSSIETARHARPPRAVTCPSLTLVGEEDIIIYPKLSRRLHDELPRSTWVEVPGGHALPLGASPTPSTRRCWRSWPRC